MKALLRFAVVMVGLIAGNAFAQFDQTHKAWDDLLKKHVKYVQNGSASRVDYAGFAKDRAALKGVLDSYSALPKAEFDKWPKPAQQAFLVNAYNAYTVELILTKYPDLKSIRDLGSFVSKPWSKKFFTLFGRKFTLDGIEHETLRKKGAYDEPRVHFAVNCASIGCPMLREEAYVADRLDAQLEQQAQRFLSDPTRNRAAGGKLEVSMIFNWFKVDWTSGYQGIQSREQYFARYATLLSDDPAQQKIVAEGKAPISHLEYDWSLNDARK